MMHGQKNIKLLHIMSATFFFWENRWNLCLYPECKKRGIMGLVFQNASSDTNLN